MSADILDGILNPRAPVSTGLQKVIDFVSKNGLAYDVGGKCVVGTTCGVAHVGALKPATELMQRAMAGDPKAKEWIARFKKKSDAGDPAAQKVMGLLDVPAMALKDDECDSVAVGTKYRVNFPDGTSKTFGSLAEGQAAQKAYRLAHQPQRPGGGTPPRPQPQRPQPARPQPQRPQPARPQPQYGQPQQPAYSDPYGDPYGYQDPYGYESYPDEGGQYYGVGAGKTSVRQASGKIATFKDLATAKAFVASHPGSRLIGGPGGGTPQRPQPARPQPQRPQPARPGQPPRPGQPGGPQSQQRAANLSQQRAAMLRQQLPGSQLVNPQQIAQSMQGMTLQQRQLFQQNLLAQQQANLQSGMFGQQGMYGQQGYPAGYPQGYQQGMYGQPQGQGIPQYYGPAMAPGGQGMFAADEAFDDGTFYEEPAPGDVQFEDEGADSTENPMEE